MLQLIKLNYVVGYSLVSFFIAFLLYPGYIKFLRYLKFGQTLRDYGTSGGKATIFKTLHQHKVGIPTMGGGLLLLVVAGLVAFSFVLKKIGLIKYSLLNQRETYILLFAFFSMGILGIIDDFLNIRGIGKVKGLTAKMKLLRMFFFSSFIAYWFYVKLGVDWINFWPLDGILHLGILFPIFIFFFTVFIVNAVNITDGLDGLVGGLTLIILFILGTTTFFYKWYLATALIGVVIGALLAFLWFNINPAKVFLGDSGALALGGLISSLVYLLNIKMGIFIPFLILFLLFEIELFSSFLQIFSKKVFNRKIFPIAPFHHTLEYKGRKEPTIVMKFRLLQGVLGGITLILIFYQFVG